MKEAEGNVARKEVATMEKENHVETESNGGIENHDESVAAGRVGNEKANEEVETPNHIVNHIGEEEKETESGNHTRKEGDTDERTSEKESEIIVNETGDTIDKEISMIGTTDESNAEVAAGMAAETSVEKDVPKENEKNMDESEVEMEIQTLIDNETVIQEKDNEETKSSSGKDVATEPQCDIGKVVEGNLETEKPVDSGEREKGKSSEEEMETPAEVENDNKLTTEIDKLCEKDVEKNVDTEVNHVDTGKESEEDAMEVDSTVKDTNEVEVDNDSGKGISENEGASTSNDITLAEEKPAADSESEDDDRPTIFVRNFSEIAEQDSDDDVIVLDDDDDDKSIEKKSIEVISLDGDSPVAKKRKQQEVQKPVKTYAGRTKAVKTRHITDIATFDDRHATLEMNVEEDADAHLLLYNSLKMSQQEKAFAGFSKLRKALLQRKRLQLNKPTTVNGQAPITMTPSFSRIVTPLQTPRPAFVQSNSIVQNAVRQMQINKPNQTNIVRVQVPNLTPINTMPRIVVSTNQSLPLTTVGAGAPRFQHVTNTKVSSVSSVPRVATTISSGNQPNLVNVQQLQQLIFDPSAGLLLYPANQVIRTQVPHQTGNQPPQASAPLRIQNGMIIRPADQNYSARSYGSNNRTEVTQVVNVSQGLSPHQVQVQRIPPPSPVRQVNAPLPRQPLPPRIVQTQPVRPPTPIRSPLHLPNQISVQRQPQPRLSTPRAPTPPIAPPRPVLQNAVPRTPPLVLPIKPNIVLATPNINTDMSGITAGNQKPIPGTVEESDNDLQNKTFPSLVVNVKTCLRGKIARQVLAKSRTDLDATVKAVLIHTPAKFVEWLMRRGLLKLDHFCDSPKHKAINMPCKLGMYSDVNKQPFSGGYVWTADCCSERQVPVFTGSLFDGSKYPPGTVLKLIYHWACQTPATNILQWVKVTSFYLKNFFTLLRAVCIAWLHENCPPLGGERKYVEIGVITLGSSAETSRGVKNVNVEILGVFDPATKIVRMKVINSLQGLFKDKGKVKPDADEQGARAFQILWPLTHWVDKRSILVVDGIIDKALFHELGFKNIQQCGENLTKSSPTNMNIMNYLRHVVPKMFSSTLSVLSKSIVQQFLDELSWREMYGTNVHDSYENMLNHVGLLTKWNFGEPLLSRLNKINQNPFADWSYTKQVRRSPLNTIPITLRNEPGIRDCIRHLMKEEAKNTVPSAQQPAVPQAAPIKPITAPQPQQVPPVISLVGQKRKIENKVENDMACYKIHYTKSRKTLSLQNHYFGYTTVGSPKTWALQPFSQNLKCPLCVRTFTSNREVIKHIVMHVSAMGRGSETSLCLYCLKEVGTGMVMQEHIRDVHKLDRVKYKCRICEEKFQNEEDLVVHMWHLHVEAECPYSCGVCDFATSLQSELVEHFYDNHGGISYVLCPYCLKVLSARSLTFLKTVVVHLQSHQLKRTKKCNRCVLSFGNDVELRSHLVAHASWKIGERAEHWQPCSIPVTEENIMMAEPPPTKSPLLPATVMLSIPAKRPKLNVVEKKKPAEVQKSTLNMSFSVPIDTNEKFGGSTYKINIPPIGKGKATCSECKEDITNPNHFIGRLICTKCRYITSCRAAMDLHHERTHIPNCKRTKPGMLTKQAEMLSAPLECKCGFLSLHPFKLAHHLSRCEKITAYPKNRTPLYTEVMGDDVPPRLPMQQDPSDEQLVTSTKNVNPETDLMKAVENSTLNPLTDQSDVSLSLPPTLSPTVPMPQSPLTVFETSTNNSSSLPPQKPPTDEIDSLLVTSSWDSEGWDLPSLPSLPSNCS